MNLSSYTSEFKKNLKIAYPVMLGQLGHVLVGLADNLMVGKLGAAPLASVSLANGLMFIFLSLGIGFSFAITPLMAEADGEQNIEKGKTIFQHGIFLTIILGFIICGMLLIAQPLMNFMQQPYEVVELAKPYYQVIAYSMIPVMIFQGFKQFADGLSMTKYAMQATIIANIINVFFNYVLIYGKLGFPALGVVGSAYGTLFSRFFMVAFMIYIISKTKQFKPYIDKFSFVHIKKSVLKRIYNLGYPTALQMWFEVSLFASGVFLAGVLGTNAQAANQIALNLASMTFMIAVGLGVTATIRVGNQKGLKNYKELRRIGISIFLLMIIIDLFFALAFILFKDILPTYYVQNIDVIETAAILIVIAGFFQLSDGIQAVVLGALRGLQDVKIPMLITFIAYWVIGFPICFYLALHTSLKATGIWVGLLISLTASAIMLYLRFNKLTHKLIVEKHELT
ncbi:MATE family efflux transporter [Tenacibaculum sp. IB213877]|uniref:MATE family efflux transporter n=1 Tax=Tenacibaculum sp. IB213877 TaxID=3097351 RepID=UPI002A59CFB9|nr:MATE family efflux transporter [Tenacibaculum sp. IB213877]MDY0781445.1 MATE family efflux transporter [Tenacibaculum sp. IB213877]